MKHKKRMRRQAHKRPVKKQECSYQTIPDAALWISGKSAMKYTPGDYTYKRQAAKSATED
jgi:hypothetical protein